MTKDSFGFGGKPVPTLVDTTKRAEKEGVDAVAAAMEAGAAAVPSAVGGTPLPQLATPDLIPAEPPIGKALRATAAAPTSKTAVEIGEALGQYFEQAAAQIEAAGDNLVALATSRRETFKAIADGIRAQGREQTSSITSFVVEVHDSTTQIDAIAAKFTPKG
jgi:hypothetical protein